ncbi:MAG: hypothetical protein JW706_01060 [Opitutales bacterium]|nr:hypothetical protein [Opitutales bacterium]
MTHKNKVSVFTTTAALATVLLVGGCMTHPVSAPRTSLADEQTRFEQIEPHGNSLDKLYADQAELGRTGNIIMDGSNPLVQVIGLAEGKSFAIAVRVPDGAGQFVIRSFLRPGTQAEGPSAFYPQVIALDDQGKRLAMPTEPILRYEKARLLYNDPACFMIKAIIPAGTDRLAILTDFEIASRGGMLADTYTAVFDAMSREYGDPSPEPTPDQKLERIKPSPTGSISLRFDP